MKPVIMKAGHIAMKHYTRVKATLKDDQTVVTAADLEVQELLVEALIKHYPEDGIVAEEEGMRKSTESGRYWIIDPIDGTLPFCSGFPSWTIALGLIEENAAVAGFISAPASNDYYSVVPGELPQRNGQSKRVKRMAPLGPRSITMTHSKPHRHYLFSKLLPGRVFSLGTASLQLAYVATGSADAVMIGYDKIWDIAPGLALLNAGGGVLRYLDGSDVIMDDIIDGKPVPHPMLGGRAEMIDQVLEHLSYWPERG